MQGLINRAIEAFLTDTFGTGLWMQAAQGASIRDADGFAAIGHDEPLHALEMLNTAARVLNRPRDSLLEDLGAFLVSNPRFDPLRRLLRFGGVSFTDFLHSLEDLQGRTRLAVPELELPELTMEAEAPGQFRLVCHACPEGFGHVLAGALRALADDYGALAVLVHQGTSARRTTGATVPDGPGNDDEIILIELYDPAFHAGRRFQLAQPDVR